MKKLHLFLFLVLCNQCFSQLITKNETSSIVDAGLGISKIRNGYLLYTDIMGLPYINQNEKYLYSPMYSIRGKITDGHFKYRLSLNFAADRVNNIVHDTSYIHTTGFNFRGFYPRLGFERTIWSKWVEFKLGVDFLYVYQLYDINSYCKGLVIPNLPLEMNATSKHVTKAWGVSPFIMLGVAIKKHFFISLESGKHYAYGTTNSKYLCNTVNLNNNQTSTMDEVGKPSEYYMFKENNYFQISIDYRFLNKE